jgi:chorismate lyase / 3-hydroxybenzoate synthase
MIHSRKRLVYDIPDMTETAMPKVLPLLPHPPAWVTGMFAEDPTQRALDPTGAVTVLEHERFVLVSTCVREATLLSMPVFTKAVASVYRSLACELTLRQRYPLRVWNFIPDIQAPMDEVSDRYMAFNAGRFEGYVDWFGGRATFGASVPTSSAVGVNGRDLWVYAMASDTPGVSIENPRQTSSYCYSSRYGPCPPCFARATKCGSTLFIGGTASILGEDSRHQGDIDEQTRESLRNIAAVIQAAGGSPVRPLAALRNVRVHVVAAEYTPAVKSILEEAGLLRSIVELVQAELCRKELLVEIEGTASLP